MDDDGGEEDGQAQVKLVADKLVWGRQLIQVITFLPSCGIRPADQQQGHRLRRLCGPYVGPTIDDCCHQTILGHYIQIYMH